MVADRYHLKPYKAFFVINMPSGDSGSLCKSPASLNFRLRVHWEALPAAVVAVVSGGDFLLLSFHPYFLIGVL